MSTSSGRSPGQPSTARGQLTRQKLLEAAEAVFGEKGYERASITDLTQRAGVAQGTFYVYFPDKKAIFVELVRDLSHRLRKSIADAVTGLEHRLDIERVGFRAFFTFMQEHRNFYRIMRQAEFVDEELFRWYYQRIAEGYIKGLSKAIDEGQIRRFDPETLAYCLMGIGDFLGMRWVLWEGRIPPEEVFESAVKFIVHGMEVPLAEERTQEGVSK